MTSNTAPSRSARVIPLAFRERYQCDDGVDLMRLSVLLIAAGLSIGGGWILNCLYHANQYYPIVSSMLLALALGSCLEFLIRAAKCRNRWIAVMYGTTAAGLVYAAFFYFDMKSVGNGWEKCGVMDVPAFIRARCTWIAQGREFGDAVVKIACLTILPLLISAGYCAKGCWDAAIRAFSTEHQRWFQREVWAARTRSVESFTAAFEQRETLERVIQEFRTYLLSDGMKNIMQSEVALEYTTADRPLEYPVYFSVKDTRNAKGRVNLWGAAEIRQLRLTIREALEIQSLFPKFQELIQDRHDLSSETPGDSDVITTTEFATVTDIPDSDRDRAGQFWFKAMTQVIIAAPLVLMAVGLCLLFLNSLLPDAWTGWALLASFVLMVAGLGLMKLGYVAHNTRQTEFDRAVEQRAEAVARRDTPGSRFVVGATRADVQAANEHVGNEVGYVVNSATDEAVLFESDERRYVIPWRSIVSCRSEMISPTTNRALVVYYVTLKFRTPNDVQELLLSVLVNDIDDTNAAIRRATEGLFHEIKGSVDVGHKAVLCETT